MKRVTFDFIKLVASGSERGPLMEILITDREKEYIDKRISGSDYYVSTREVINDSSNRILVRAVKILSLGCVMGDGGFRNPKS